MRVGIVVNDSVITHYIIDKIEKPVIWNFRPESNKSQILHS